MFNSQNVVEFLRRLGTTKVTYRISVSLTKNQKTFRLTQAKD